MKKYLLFFVLLLPAAFDLPAMDGIYLWRHSEIAGKNSVFADIGLAPLCFENFEFSVLPIEARVEWMLPLPLPFSLGVFLKTPYPNLKSFGLRLAYHFDLLDPRTDFYLAYSFDFGFVRNDILAEHNDTPAEIYWYDFRLGVRHFFGSRFGLAVESGFKFESVVLMLSIKIN